MADWNEIKNDLKKTVSGVGRELTKIGTRSATRLKLNSLKVELAELFEALGRISYKKLREKLDEDASTEEIASLLLKIDEKRRMIKQLESELEEILKEDENND